MKTPFLWMKPYFAGILGLLNHFFGFLAACPLLFASAAAICDDGVKERIQDLPGDSMPLGIRIRFKSDLVLPANKSIGAVVCSEGQVPCSQLYKTGGFTCSQGACVTLEDMNYPNGKLEWLSSEIKENRHVVEGREEYDQGSTMASHCTLDNFKGIDDNKIAEDSWFQITRVRGSSKHEVSYTLSSIPAQGYSADTTKEFTVSCFGKSQTVRHYSETRWSVALPLTRCDFASCGEGELHTVTEFLGTTNQNSDVTVSDFLEATSYAVDVEAPRKQPKKNISTSIGSSSWSSRAHGTTFPAK